ncbi:MAG: 2-oxo acid dehydrogenase subunit E2 [Desulfobacterales bacterium]|nr:2-oxo acid dehydrogenase subunit E2 [Desulfobacterales bacterium]
MIKDIKIPEISENVESGTIISILVKVGDRVGADDPVIEFETDKAVVEIPSPVAGKITEILVEEGEEKNVGDVIAKVDTEGKAEESEKKPEEEEGPQAEKEAPEEEEKETEERREAPERAESAKEEEEPSEKAELEKEAAGTEAEPAEKATTPEAEEKAGKEPEKKEEGGKMAAPAPAGPSVRRLARELGVEVGQVRGTGPGGRITEADVKGFVKEGREKQQPREKGPPQRADETPSLPDFSRWGEVETEKLDNVRRLTAEGTAVSWDAIPHVTQFDEADITSLQPFFDKNAGRVEKAGGKLTVTAVILKVCAAALRQFPRFNASIDLGERKLIYKKYIHIGVMVDTPRGLLVPVVRDADTKTITELAVEIVDLADRARNKKIKPDEMEGGTFSISNQGSIGGSGFTPVVLWPQAAILGISRAATAAKHRNGGFEPRLMLPMSLSYDHRIVDGADAARFMRWICECLEQPFTMNL